jgi:hypothetical protein
MNFLLRLKHWQLFLLLIGLPIIITIAMIITIEDSFPGRVFKLISPVLTVFGATIFLGWFYAVGTNLHKKLPGSVKMNLTSFKISLFLLVAYILFICVFMIATIDQTITDEVSPPIGNIMPIIPVHLFSVFCIFYCLYFTAKALKAVELQRPVTFGHFADEFFLLWCYPIGIWFIQPRINKLFDNTNQLPE